MTTDLLDALREVVGQEAFDIAQALPRSPYDGAPDFEGPDLHVFESDARRMQQRYDNWLERESA